ncbi:MAG: penicillin-binding protein activator LpoB [Fibromonadaceae bacterium]|jgi:hypothetical protein|nr:penicillin-binding protein activator LpoB [Fibromonadaceae bacterium]
MKTLKLIAMLLLFCNIAMAQQKSKVAIGVIGEEPPKSNALKGLGSQLTKALVKNGEYTAVDRSDAILKQIGKEHRYQRSGAVSDRQIRELGKQFGVQYMCIVESSKVMDSYLLEAKLVDVETAEIIGMGSTPSGLASIGDLIAASEELSIQLLGSGTKGRGSQRQSGSYGSGVFLDPKYKPNEISQNFIDVVGSKIPMISAGTCVSGIMVRIEAKEPSCSKGSIGLVCGIDVSLSGTDCKNNKKLNLRGSIRGMDRYREELALRQMWRRFDDGTLEFLDDWKDKLKPWMEK